MNNNANLPYQMNTSNSNAMYLYMMQCMTMNGSNANRSMMMNNGMTNPSQKMNQIFSLGFNQPYCMNPNNMNSYYKVSQRTANDNIQFKNNFSSGNNNISRNNGRGMYQDKQLPFTHQSRFLQDFDYEFDMLTKKREREDKQKELSKEEKEDINKWLEQRKRNYPSKGNIEQKKTEDELRDKIGMMSQLELKLRKKNQLLKRFEGRPNRGNLYPQPTNSYPEKRRNKSSRPMAKPKPKSTPSDVEEGEVVEELIITPTAPSSNPKRDNKGQRENKQQPTKPSRTPSFSFKYKKNNIYEMMLKQEKIIADNILLQTFRYFQKENII